MSHSEIATKIISICKRLHQRNLLAAADGNISCRVSENEILITPKGVNKAEIEPESLARITLAGEVHSGEPSSERLMHLEVYRRCPKARAVVHAHPPTAIAWTIARPDLNELPAESMSELILAAGQIPIVNYARPGTEAMGQVLVPYLPQRRILILARHGALSWGEDLDEAYNGMERLEHSAMILKAAHELGGLTALPQEEIMALREMRKKIGDRSL